MRLLTPIPLVLALALALPAAATGHDQLVTHGDPLEVMGIGSGFGPQSLPTEHCGTETGLDDTEHETGARSLHKIKAIEAVPADVSPSADVRDGIQASVSEIIGHIASESGGRRSLRFDLGTSCGPRYVDILTLRLPKHAAEYGAGACNTGPLFSDVERVMPRMESVRNLILYAPSVNCNGIAGYAQAPADDEPGEGNLSNRGGYKAVTFVMRGRTALHEIAHNLGAVQSSALHHDGTRHCWDNHDVMCYPYTQPLPKSPLRPCDFTASGVAPFDCGQDDYFNPEPAPGSYLATHWNVYESKFMCALEECVPEPAPAPAAPAPVAPVAPPPATSGQPPAAPAGEPPSPPADASPSKRARLVKRKAKRRCPKAKRAKSLRAAKRCRRARRR